MAHNGQGLSAVMIFCNSSAQPKPGKVNEGENTCCGIVLLIQAGLQMISEQDDQYIFISQHRSKPHVVRSCRYFIR